MISLVTENFRIINVCGQFLRVDFVYISYYKTITKQTLIYGHFLVVLLQGEWGILGLDIIVSTNLFYYSWLRSNFVPDNLSAMDP